MELEKYLNLHQTETLKYNREFVEKYPSLPFIQSMKERHVKRWNEDRTNLNFNSKNIHILIADDAVSQIQRIKAILGKTNVIIDSAEDGNEAYDQIKLMMDKGQIYHLILMDIHMPQCDGYKSAKNIRALELSKKVDKKNHIVAISAHENDVTQSLYQEGGMNDFIQKPISQPILLSMLA